MNESLSPVSVVVLTHNRAMELHRTLERIVSLPRFHEVVVIDNASTDSTAHLVRERFPQARLIRLKRNIGAAARNVGVHAAKSRYVAFCDDDTWWESDSLEKAAMLFDLHPDVAVLCARVLVGPEQREDPTCKVMARSPLPAESLPGPALLGFLAGAAVVRKRAFLEAGGYEPRFFIGGEEALLALDLAMSGWRMSYVAQLTVHHYPSPNRDARNRGNLLVRNALWLAWMRLPAATAIKESWRILLSELRDNARISAVADALCGLPWAIRRRKVISPELADWYRMVHESKE